MELTGILIWKFDSTVGSAEFPDGKLPSPDGLAGSVKPPIWNFCLTGNRFR